MHGDDEKWPRNFSLPFIRYERWLEYSNPFVHASVCVRVHVKVPLIFWMVTSFHQANWVQRIASELKCTVRASIEPFYTFSVRDTAFKHPTLCRLLPLTSMIGFLFDLKINKLGNWTVRMLVTPNSNTFRLRNTRTGQDFIFHLTVMYSAQNL
jgi:hypothetical protein